MKRLLILISLLSLGAHAQNNSGQNFPKFGYEGQMAQSIWSQQNPKTKVTETNNKVRLQMDGWVNLTPDGCVIARARVTTGNKLNNEWINSGMGTNKADPSLSLRHLYVSADCLKTKNLSIEAGSVPVRNFGNLGLASVGFIDGINISYKIKKDNKTKTEWRLSVGNVEAEADLLKRNIENLNHINLQVQHLFGRKERTTAYASICQFNQDILSRTGLMYEFKDQKRKWLTNTGAEMILSGTKIVGGTAYLRMKLKNWNTRLAFTSFNENPSEHDRQMLMRKQFYGIGQNFHLEGTRNISEKIDINARLRLGDAGTSAQLGMALKLKGSNKVNNQKKKLAILESSDGLEMN